MRLRNVERPSVTADLTCAASAAGNADHNKAAVPVTSGVAALVPLEVTGWPSRPRLVMASPGAITPRWPIELLRLVVLIGRPSSSHAATAMTHGCWVMAEP